VEVDSPESLCGSLLSRDQFGSAGKMRVPQFKLPVIVLLCLASLCSLNGVRAYRFLIDRKECFAQEVDEEGATVHGSFVIVKVQNRWGHNIEDAAMDITVEAPSGFHVYSARRKAEDKFQFMAVRKGKYKFCFTNHSPMHETIVFEVHVGHPPVKHGMVAKEEHFDPAIDKAEELWDSATDLYYDFHHLLYIVERHEKVGRSMAARLYFKALLHAVALIGTSALQVYLLRRLFEKKGGMSRV